MKGVQIALSFLFVAVALGWESGPNKIFEGRSIESIQKLLGWKPSGFRLAQMELPYTDVPVSFDARQQWPNCASISAIQNQAECGSCWAFGAVEAITDRFCIHENDDTQLSFQDMVSCDDNDSGCNGGDPYSAWNYSVTEGLVSAACYPYTIPTCPPAQQPCLNFVNTPPCQNACTNASINWGEDKRHLSKSYGVSPNNSGIEIELMTNGPVEACFDVYEDFLKYKSGVYTHTSGSYLGGHCVKLIGWGVDGKVPYWIVANSWTDTWGNQGYFWIARGVDECGIEDMVVAGLP